MSPAIAAARNAGPPIADGNVSIESSGALIAAVFDGDGGAEMEGIGGGGSEPVGSAALGDSGCDRDCGAGPAGAGVTVGAALGAIGGAALGGAFGAAIGCAAGSVGEFCDGCPPELPLGVTTGATSGATTGATSGAALGTGATSGVGPDAAAGAGSGLPMGCSDPLCGCAAFGFMSGGAAGSAGRCHGADASPAGRLS